MNVARTCQAILGCRTFLYSFLLQSDYLKLALIPTSRRSSGSWVIFINGFGKSLAAKPSLSTAPRRYSRMSLKSEKIVLIYGINVIKKNTKTWSFLTFSQCWHVVLKCRFENTKWVFMSNTIHKFIHRQKPLKLPKNTQKYTGF